MQATNTDNRQTKGLRVGQRTETAQGQTLWLAKKELLDPCSWPLPFVLAFYLCALHFILYMYIYIYVYVTAAVCVSVAWLPCAISLVGGVGWLADGVLGAVKYSFVFFCLSITNVPFTFAIASFSFSCRSCSACAVLLFPWKRLFRLAF